MNPSSFLPSLSAVTAGTSKILSEAKHAVTTKITSSSRPSSATEKLPPVPTVHVIVGVQSVPGAEITTVRATEITSTPRTDDGTSTAMTKSTSTGYLSKLTGYLTSSNNAPKDTCSHCGAEDSRLTMVTQYASKLERCRVCGVKLCPKCIAKVPHLMVPLELLHPGE